MVLYILTFCCGELHRPLSWVSAREIISECHGVVVDLNRCLESDFAPNLAFRELYTPLIFFWRAHQAVCLLIETFIWGLCHTQNLGSEILVIDISFCRSLNLIWRFGFNCWFVGLLKSFEGRLMMLVNLMVNRFLINKVIVWVYILLRIILILFV